MIFRSIIIMVVGFTIGTLGAQLYVSNEKLDKVTAHADLLEIELEECESVNNISIFNEHKISGSLTRRFTIKTCPICNSPGYLHKAVNDIDNPAWTIDCLKEEHDRIMTGWSPTMEEAASKWNEYKLEDE